MELHTYKIDKQFNKKLIILGMDFGTALIILKEKKDKFLIYRKIEMM